MTHCMKTFSVGPRKERFREVPCRLCGSRRFSARIQGKGYRFVACRECGLVYQNPEPVFDDLKNRYGEQYFEYERENEANFFRLMELGLRDIRFDRLTEALSGEKSFLDVGCATGMLLQHLRSLGWQVQGVELCRESAEFAVKARGLDAFIGTLEQASFPDSRFAVIHFSHLLEHLPDPVEFLAEVRRILRPDGYAIITTPNIGGFQARLFRGLWRSAIADHLTLFSKKTLRRLLCRAGFSVVQTQTWGGLANGSAPAWLKRPVDILAKRFGFGDVVLMLARPALKARGASPSVARR